MGYLEKLRSADNRKELADLLGYKPQALAYIIYCTPLNDKYTNFDIPKKGGGVRTIKAPSPKLKKLQTHLAHFLYGCLKEIDEARNNAAVSYGFREQSTVSANAKNHKRRRYVLNLDIHDFFSAFNFGRVRGYFLKDRNFLLKEEVATTIAQIACDGTALPQGSPCSPVISELIGQILDLRLLRFAKKHGVRYSRYADDLTFSTNQKEFPLAVAIQNGPGSPDWSLGDNLVQQIKSCGFTVNPSKTRMHVKGSRQMVTGLVVNEKANIKSDYYRKARAMCDSLFQTGRYYRSVSPFTASGGKPGPNFTDRTEPLEGILSHIYRVTQSEELRDTSQQRKEPRAIRKLYRRFLFYKYCVALDAPLLITEGKTDPVYLREAIRHRTVYHPLLGASTEYGFKFSLRFFNYSGQTHEIMDIGGGSGDLKSIPLDYLRNLDPKHKGRKSFSHKPLSYPVILICDNDDGLKPIAETIKNNFNIRISTETVEPFYKITDNLYIVKTPEDNGHSCIEDLFADDLRATKLNGKNFNATSKINPSTEYGKEIFAKSVVKPKAAEIDFSGFDLLLDRLVGVLENYSLVDK